MKISAVAASNPLPARRASASIRSAWHRTRPGRPCSHARSDIRNAARASPSSSPSSRNVAAACRRPRHVVRASNVSGWQESRIRSRSIAARACAREAERGAHRHRAVRERLGALGRARLQERRHAGPAAARRPARPSSPSRATARSRKPISPSRSPRPRATRAAAASRRPARAASAAGAAGRSPARSGRRSPDGSRSARRPRAARPRAPPATPRDARAAAPARTSPATRRPPRGPGRGGSAAAGSRLVATSRSRAHEPLAAPARRSARVIPVGQRVDRSGAKRRRRSRRARARSARWRRGGRGARRAARAAPAGARPRTAPLADVGDELLEEQRVAAGRLGDPPLLARLQATAGDAATSASLAASDSGPSASSLSAGRRGGGRAVRARDPDHQHRRVAQPAADLEQQVQQRGLGQLRVVDDHDDGRSAPARR